MKVEILEEHGYENAIKGMSYSYMDRSLDVGMWWVNQKSKAEIRAPKLAPMEGGHNGFLESITAWVDIEASRAWWSEMDRYRVGKTQQSQSTMHTLAKREPNYSDFEEGTHPATITQFRDVWRVAKGDINILKMNLPEGFLQRRIVCTNYKALKNIIEQRTGHRLKWWEVFIREILSQVEHPELLDTTKT